MPDKSWSLRRTTFVSDHVIFRLHQDLYQVLPERAERDFVRIEAPDWVNVIPVTDDGQVVFVRQYRHGVRHVTLEVPGGMIDPGEDPQASALREVEEETGYRAGSVRSLGYVWPNPAIQTNRCYSFLAEGAHRAVDPRPETFERIEVVTHPLERVPELIASGEIRHSLVIVAFSLMGVTATGLHRRGV
jgi:8-oxo-dGTP pyrophosphatase MutT (NUDIX family)